jgi:hypothetical protein
MMVLLGILEKNEFSLLSLDDLALPIPLEVGLKFCNGAKNRNNANKGTIANLG